ncbi:hypothetical protein C8Q78DRAFT_1018545 [Trametes maxima]|nr:hypothetical protein C8Q78DRAFT_1018545 [Trametes maxima]
MHSFTTCSMLTVRRVTGTLVPFGAPCTIMSASQKLRSLEVRQAHDIRRLLSIPPKRSLPAMRSRNSCMFRSRTNIYPRTVRRCCARGFSAPTYPSPSQ